MQQTTEVRDAPDLNRYEIRADGDLAGFAAYRLDGDRIVMTHTEIDPAFEGRGLGSALARSALDDARARGRTVEARCPFIASWIRKHQEYVDLLAPRG